MVLSDDAKRFAIAREIHRGQTISYLSNGIILPTFIVVGYLTSRLINKKFLLFKRPPIFRLAMYCVVASFATYTSVFFEDAMKYFTEGGLDEKTCNLGVRYTKGGIEYYDKIIRSNIALRTLHPDNQGKNMFNIQGNPWPSFFRPYKYKPFTLRKQACIDVYSKIEQNMPRFSCCNIDL